MNDIEREIYNDRRQDAEVQTIIHTTGTIVAASVKILGALPVDDIVDLTDKVYAQLVKSVREHYKETDK